MMDIQTPKIVEKLNENFIDELERLEKLDPVRSRPGFKEVIALLVVLSSSKGDESGRESEDQNIFIGYYNRLCTIFSSITCMKDTIGSMNNFGKPLIRYNQQSMLSESVSHEPAPSVLSGPTGHDNCISKYLWKLMDSVFMEVPSSYHQGFSAALLYLIAMETGTSFHGPRADEALEIPCLLEMLRHSSCNNANCVCSLFGEYLSLVRICCFEEYSGEKYWYRCLTTTFDFCIVKEHRDIKYFSVKTVNRTGFSRSSCFDFATDHNTLDCETKFVCGEDEANIFIHDCCCEVCLQHPVRKVCINGEHDFLDELHSLACSSNEKLENVLGAVNLEVIERKVTETVGVYLVSGRVVYELRNALFYFDQEKFRGYKFKLREFLVNNLRRNAQASNFDESVRIETLRSRTCV